MTCKLQCTDLRWLSQLGCALKQLGVFCLLNGAETGQLKPTFADSAWSRDASSVVNAAPPSGREQPRRSGTAPEVPTASPDAKREQSQPC